MPRATLGLGDRAGIGTQSSQTSVLSFRLLHSTRAADGTSGAGTEILKFSYHLREGWLAVLDLQQGVGKRERWERGPWSGGTGQGEVRGEALS